MTTYKAHLHKVSYKHPFKVKAKLPENLVLRLFQVGNPKLWYTFKWLFFCCGRLLHLCTSFLVMAVFSL